MHANVDANRSKQASVLTLLAVGSLGGVGKAGECFMTAMTVCAGGGGSSLQSQVSMGRSPPVSTASALEEYSRTGDVRLLQHTSALMGSPDAGQVRSLECVVTVAVA